jgi:hypothetical protein
MAALFNEPKPALFHRLLFVKPCYMATFAAEKKQPEF